MPLSFSTGKNKAYLDEYRGSQIVLAAIRLRRIIGVTRLPKYSLRFVFCPSFFFKKRYIKKISNNTNKMRLK